MDAFWLLLRVAVSLVVVVALIWVLARVRKRVGPKGASSLQVVSKIPVSRRGALLLVEIEGKILLLGSTETNISLLSEVERREDEVVVKQERTPIDFDSLLQHWDAGSLDDAGLPPYEPAGAELEVMQPAVREQSALAGSVLSPQTWRQLTQVLRERTVRS